MLVNNTNTNSNYNNSTNSYSILLIDDEVDILSVIKRPLQEYGFDICSFTKPAIALEHYKTNSNTHHLVISDLQMPNMNGFEFIRKVKEINSKIKVFLMTSSFEVSDLGLLLLPKNSSSINLMIDEFILKPFSIQKLIILIRKHIGIT
jgi:CheY-like chemotaxis protein